MSSHDVIIYSFNITKRWDGYNLVVNHDIMYPSV